MKEIVERMNTKHKKESQKTENESIEFLSYLESPGTDESLESMNKLDIQDYEQEPQKQIKSPELEKENIISSFHYLQDVSKMYYLLFVVDYVLWIPSTWKFI